MAITKKYRTSPDVVVKTATYAEGAPVVFAHLNAVVDEINDAFASINTTTDFSALTALGNTTDLTAIAGSWADVAAANAAVTILRSETEARLAAIEAKVDAIIAALKA